MSGYSCGGYGGQFAFILVIFVLLVIIGCTVCGGY
ncbi:YjcZ family sporulation protein [Bacillus sp. V5-8f]|nr:YjcZ family sporulation protein [Bacillus sp. V5-8f]PLT33129.1 sporulation protein YjcZ [Bacillus sp. V5-8f]